jgi:hypothetical protein
MGCTTLCGPSYLDCGGGTEIGVVCLMRFGMSLSINESCQKIKIKNSRSVFTGLKI